MTDAPPILGPLFVVAAALINADGRVLVQQRPAGKSMPGLWEFPGGKIEAGETPVAALVRELAEELAIEIDAADLEPVAFADAPLGAEYEGRRLILLLYLLRRWRGEPRAVEATALAWHDIDALGALPMPPADLPLVEALRRLL